MKHFPIAGLLILILMATASPTGWAAETSLVPGEKPLAIPPLTRLLKPYFNKVSPKFDFGIVNFLTGWTAMVSEPIDHYQKASSQNTRLINALGGFGQGLVEGAANTVGGLLNVVTAPLPQFTIPLPRGGVDSSRITG